MIFLFNGKTKDYVNATRMDDCSQLTPNQWLDFEMPRHGSRNLQVSNLIVRSVSYSDNGDEKLSVSSLGQTSLAFPRHIRPRSSLLLGPVRDWDTCSYRHRAYGCTVLSTSWTLLLPLRHGGVSPYQTSFSWPAGATRRWISLALPEILHHDHHRPSSETTLVVESTTRTMR